MLLQLFRTVLLQSAVGAVLAIILLLVKPITKRIFGSCWQYYIWLCVLVVMILPPVTVLVPEKSVTGLPELPQMVFENTNRASEISSDPEIKIVETKPLEYRNIELTQGLSISRKYNPAVYVWIAGALMFFVLNAKNYLLFFLTIQRNSKLVSCPLLECIKKEKRIESNIRVRTTKCINSPLILGFFQHTLLLPDMEIPDESLRNVLLHELTHHKRRDLWCKLFSMIVNSIHWFNPVIYLVIRQMNEACENSCDFTVVKDMDTEERKGYMSTVLYMMAKNKHVTTLLVSAMSSGKGQIERRLKMIIKEKRHNRFISALSLLTAFVVLCTTLFTGSVFAAATKDDLEIWTDNEVYFKGATEFLINVSGKNVPDWVFANIAGADGNINVTVNFVEIRDLKGKVEECEVLELKGAKGITKLSAAQRSSLNKPNKANVDMRRIPELFDAAYTNWYRFHEFNNIGYSNEYRKSLAASLVTENSGKGEYVEVNFAVDENKTLSAVYIEFLESDADDNVSSYFPYLKADFNSIKYSGNFKKDFVSWSLAGSPNYFTSSEKDFVNKKVTGIDISVKSADTQGIILNASVTHPQVSYYEVYVYNKIERNIAFERGVPYESIAIEPRLYKNVLGNYEFVPGCEWVKGEKYRVDIVLFDKDGKAIYRQREYVNMPNE